MERPRNGKLTYVSIFIRKQDCQRNRLRWRHSTCDTTEGTGDRVTGDREYTLCMQYISSAKYTFCKHIKNHSLNCDVTEISCFFYVIINILHEALTNNGVITLYTHCYCSMPSHQSNVPVCRCNFKNFTLCF